MDHIPLRPSATARAMSAATWARLDLCPPPPRGGKARARPVAGSPTPRPVAGPPIRDKRQEPRALGVQAILEWAFGREKAQLELPPPPDAEAEAQGYGLEYVLYQRAQLGCQIDGGRYKIGSYTHEDAEAVAAVVANLPDALGGKRMAIRIAELARAGLTPDWMPGAVPRCVPVEVRRNQHGVRAKTEVVGTAQVTWRGRTRRVDILACPVTWPPHPDQIADARRAYEGWWQALNWVREGLVTGGMLREVVVSEVMPRRRPWGQIDDTSL